jgi:putative hydrolase of HD superfamily
MITNLESKLRFIELIDEMKSINRTITLKCGRKESDADHSYHLAMMVMILIDDFPELDALKCIKLALLHDLVEIFAGDTYIFDHEWVKSKQEREHMSLLRIEELVGKDQFREFRSIIDEYESHETREAQFVYQLDKLHPIIQIYMTNGCDFQSYKTNTEELIANKYSKIDDTFGFREILDQYLMKMEKGNMYYNPNK